MKYKNLKIIGTSHIAKQSIEEVKNEIEKNSPEIVALELDRQRLYALLHEQKRSISFKDIKRIGLNGYLFSLIASWAEKKLGKVVNTKPGDEMRAAVETASKKGIKLALIDQNITITLKKLSKAITFREKWHFFMDIIKSALFGKSELRKLGIKNLDLRKVPEKRIVNIMIKKMKTDYPSLYSILVIERNEYMAKKLIRLMKTTKGGILAVVGAGHAEEIIKIIKNNINKMDFI